MPDLLDDEEMMQSPEKWPLWPVLPVKQRNGMSSSRLGIMREGAFGVKPVVYLVTLYEVKTGQSWDDLEKFEYLDFEGVVDDGWVVD